jgi:hypothetical protein
MFFSDGSVLDRTAFVSMRVLFQWHTFVIILRAAMGMMLVHAVSKRAFFS